MPFCPDCGYEYREGIKTCPQCEVVLVSQLEVQPVGGGDYTEIYMVSNRMEAEVVSGVLRENGIDFLIRDLRAFPVLPDFGRRARLRIAVQSDREQQARKLLEEAREDGALTDQGRFL